MHKVTKEIFVIKANVQYTIKLMKKQPEILHGQINMMTWSHIRTHGKMPTIFC